MTCRIGINGFGRIGRMVLRRTLTHADVEVVAVNDLAHIGDLAYLLKYDSVHGLFPGEVSHDDQAILVNDRAMQFSSEKDPAKIPWGQAGVDVVIESTGAFRGRKDAAGHLQGGARKVLISAPSDDVDVTLVPGVNDAQYDPARHHVLSMASCTTNSLAPVAKVLHEHFGIAHLLITTVHAYTTSQSIMDKPTRKRRRGRAGALSMIPTSTGAAQATALVLPELAGKVDGMAIRVPVPDGSVTDIVAQLERRPAPRRSTPACGRRPRARPCRAFWRSAMMNWCRWTLLGIPIRPLWMRRPPWCWGAPWPRCWPGTITSGATPVVWPSWRGV